MRLLAGLIVTVSCGILSAGAVTAQGLQLAQFADTVFVGERQIVANAYFFGSDSCNWEADDVSFDSGDVSEFSAQPDSALPWIDGIYVAPSHPGTLHVTGNLIYRGWNPHQNSPCGPWTEPFSIELIAISRSGVTPGYAPAQNASTFPDPFEDRLFLHFILTKGQDVGAHLFNLSGSQVRTEESYFESGNQQIVFDTRTLSPGVYFFVLHGAGWRHIGRLVKFP